MPGLKEDGAHYLRKTLRRKTLNHKLSYVTWQWNLACKKERKLGHDWQTARRICATNFYLHGHEMVLSSTSDRTR